MLDSSEHGRPTKIECREAFARAAEACIDNRYPFVGNLGASLLHANGADRPPIRREAAHQREMYGLAGQSFELFI